MGRLVGLGVLWVFLSLSFFFRSLRYTGLGAGLDVVRRWTCQAVAIGDGTVGDKLWMGFARDASSNRNYNTISTFRLRCYECGLSASQHHIAM